MNITLNNDWWNFAIEYSEKQEVSKKDRFEATLHDPSSGDKVSSSAVS